MSTKIDTGSRARKADAEDPVAAISRRVRYERESRNWTLADVATRSGVSKAMISKIERAEVSPSATVLVRLAGAFDLSLAGLLVRAEGAGGRLSKASEQSKWRDPATGYVRRQIWSQPQHPIEIARIEMPPKKRVTFPVSSYVNVRQVVWVLKGKLIIREDSGQHTLNVGDCLAFGPPSEVTLANESSAPCTYLVVKTQG